MREELLIYEIKNINLNIGIGSIGNGVAVGGYQTKVK